MSIVKSILNRGKLIVVHTKNILYQLLIYITPGCVKVVKA